MEGVKKSLKILASVTGHRTLVDNFARSKYEEKYGNLPIQYSGYHAYSGFDVISENKIRVNYEYGAGEMDFHDSFDVEI